MELMLWRLQKTTSSIMSCSVMARPRSASTRGGRRLEHDALAVDGQDAVLDAEAAETDLLGRAFDDVSRLVDDVDVKLVQRRASALQGAMPCSGPLEIAVCASASPSSATPCCPSASFRVARTVAASAP